MLRDMGGQMVGFGPEIQNRSKRQAANTNPFSVVFNLWLRRVQFGGFYELTSGLYRFWSKKN